MNSRWQKIEKAVSIAADIPASQRQVWLEEFCSGDDDLCSEIESLLKHETSVANFLEQPIAPYAATLLEQFETKSAGQIIGPYKIIRELGRGGMGVVYLAAREDEQFRQQVAIKLVKRGLDTEDILRRFRNERQILASLNHPNIAKLFDGGMTSDGLPYFVMEYIEGLPLLQYCDDRNVSTNDRLALFRRVCAAVQHAHQNLVIHRDLKPSNILVTHDGEVKLLDFGVAKLVNPALTGGGLTQTQAVFRVMTLEYASPEQVRDQHVTTATDIYSLGVTLYELLTGTRPYRFKDTSPAELSKAICDSQPSKPSEAISDKDQSTGSEHRHTALNTSNAKSLRGDLDNMILMALRKDPARRYKSAEQFSEDIRRHLHGLPVIARADTLAYRSSKFIKRNRIAVVAAALILLTLIGGIIATAWQSRIARRQRDTARLEKAKAERINSFMQDMLGLTNPGWFAPSLQRDHDVTVKELLDEMANRVETEMSDQPEVQAAMQRSIGNSYFYRTRFDLAEHHLHAALEADLKLYGEQNQETARTLTLLGNARLQQGDPAGAQVFHQRAVEVFRKEYAAGNAEARWYVAACSGYGQDLKAKGDLKNAADLYNEGLKLSPQVSGNDRAVIAIMLTNLAFVRADQQNLDEAEALHRQALQEFRSLPGRTRSEVGSTFTGLGEVLTAKGRFAEAQQALREGLAAYRTVWGDDSAYIAGNLTDQSVALYRSGDFEGAERQAAKSLESYRKRYPEGHVAFATPLIILGLSMNKTARSTQAEPLLRQALDIRTRALPQGSYVLAFAKGSLGECLTTQKRYPEAEPLLIQSYDNLKTTLGEGHARTIEAKQRLYTLYEAWGKHDLMERYR